MTFLGTMAESWLDRAATIGADPDDDPERRLRKGLLLLIIVMILPVSLVWGTVYLLLGSPVGYVPYAYAAISVAAVAIYARTHDAEFLLRVELLDILFAPTLSQIPLGGFLASGGVGLWGILAPLGALVFRGVSSGGRWFAAFLAVFLISGVTGELVSRSSLPSWFNSGMIAANTVAGATIVFILLALFAKQRQEAVAALRVEQDKAENLLLNILPRSIADKLKADTSTIADQFAAASILFADVVNFTPFSERLPAVEVVGVLDGLFTEFDALADKYGVEKIKTIGDCYMVAAGVPLARPDHADALALMALDMQAAMSAGDAHEHRGLELRIGINSGPVIAGVIGRKRFLYDLWGDAVNTASRMESQGTAGRIQVTRATYELLKDDFVLERRGTVEVKGKGAMETWYLVSERGAETAMEATELPVAVPAAGT